jgi:hypothetical protein
MKTKKHTIQISICLICISFIILIFLQFRLYPLLLRNQFYKLLFDNASALKELLIIIFGGIFTSSFVVLMIGIVEYQGEKRKALEHYYSMSRSFLQHFKNIEYFEPRHPKELVQKCFWEESNNRIKEDMNNQMDNIAIQSGENIKAMLEKLSHKEKARLVHS